MKKVIYFCIFLITGLVCLYDSFVTLSKTPIPPALGLAIISLSIGILFILLWLEFKEVALATGILLWGIPLTNAYEMSKAGNSLEEILFFILSRIAMGIVFYFAVSESVEIAKSEFKEKRR
jgi:hypothetical protein